ncbi:DUF262 domain-containing protein [Rothia nasimurium]|uniref:DUF262 domain-containing protein n=1 Tax=Rothia nasimurium TaxID=85336 RepID=UPI001F206AAA|nr:DUF262 domain-containing protein [Rothia nasimurium]
MKIDAKDLITKELFKQKFSIPRFQRKYSWKNEELSKFWDDIIPEDFPSNHPNEDNEYFIGSVIVYPYGGRKAIIDGQQRITTLTILFSAIRDHLFSVDPALAKALHTNVIEDAENIDGEKEFILNNLVMSQENWQSFMKYILDENSRLTEKPSKKSIEKNEELLNILNAYQYFYNEINKKVEGIEGDEKINLLKSIRDKVLNVKLIEISLEDFSKAYTIFNTLNSRGKNLSDSDLIKSLFTEILDSRSQNDQTLFTWRNIEDNLNEAKSGNGRAASQLFFFDSFTSQNISVRKKGDIYPTYQNVINEENAESMLANLEQDSIFYKHIFNSNYKFEQNGFGDINKSLEALGIFNIIQPSSLLLSLLRKNQVADSPATKLSTKNLRESLRILENFHFIYNAVTTSPGNRLNNIYPSFAKRIFAENNNSKHREIIEDLRKTLQEKIPSEDEFILKFKNINYNTGNARDKMLVQYILKKLHLEYYNFGITGSDWSSMSVEHLLSQAESSRHNIHANIYGQLGNLLYVDKKVNERDLKDLDFIDKKDILIEKSIQIPTEILQKDSWDEADISERTENMAAVAYNTVWKL